MNRRGVSLVEALFYCAIAAWLGLSAVRYLKLPTHLNTMMRAATSEQAGYSATAAPIDDLKCSLSSSIQWNLIDPTQLNPPYNPAVHSRFIPWFQVNDPDILPLPISYVCYRYRDADGALIRHFIPGAPPTASPLTACAPVAGDHAQEAVIAKGLLPPTPDAPLFSKDQSSTNMVILTLRVNTGGKTPATIVRRVHIRS